MKKLYSIYNDKFEIIGCEYFEENNQPTNSISLLPNGQIKPIYDSVNDVIIEGSTQEEIDAAYRATIPQIVTPRQLKTQLILSGISLSAIDTMIDALDEPEKSVTRIAWEYSTDFDRNNPMILAFAPLLNLSETDVDNIFIAASQL